MSDDPFERPTETTRASLKARSFGQPSSAAWPADNVEVSIIVDREQGNSRISSVRTPRTMRVCGVIAATLVALLAGIVIGALTIDRPIPNTPITLESFPREVLGSEREDVELRDGNAEAVIDRLDSQFEAQLAGYRFAYGGEGAQFSYGNYTTLVIVNGKLAPQLPVEGDTLEGPSTVISLNTKDTKCSSETVIIKNEYSLMRGPEEAFVWTDCVLLDERRNLALRLIGRLPGVDIIEAANRFRDELERIHANLT